MKRPESCWCVRLVTFQLRLEGDDDTHFSGHLSGGTPRRRPLAAFQQCDISTIFPRRAGVAAAPRELAAPTDLRHQFAARSQLGVEPSKSPRPLRRRADATGIDLYQRSNPDSSPKSKMTAVAAIAEPPHSAAPMQYRRMSSTRRCCILRLPIRALRPASGGLRPSPFLRRSSRG